LIKTDGPPLHERGILTVSKSGKAILPETNEIIMRNYRRTFSSFFTTDYQYMYYIIALLKVKS